MDETQPQSSSVAARWGNLAPIKIVLSFPDSAYPFTSTCDPTITTWCHFYQIIGRDQINLYRAIAGRLERIAYYTNVKAIQVIQDN
jgi:hypothetical protein